MLGVVGVDAAAAGSQPSASSSACAGRALVERSRAVVARFDRRFDQQMGPERIPGVVRQVQPAAIAGSGQRQVALGHRRDRPEPMTPRIDAERRDPVGLGTGKVVGAKTPSPTASRPSPNSPS